MAKRDVIVLTDCALITATLPRGAADDIVKAAQEAGAQGASIHYAHGRGVRERLGLLGLALEVEKEVINIVVSTDQVNHVFERMYLAGQFDVPGRGFMWVTPIEKAATFIPPEIVAKHARRPS